jgi:hypothetical protein
LTHVLAGECQSCHADSDFVRMTGEGQSSREPRNEQAFVGREQVGQALTGTGSAPFQG